MRKRMGYVASAKSLASNVANGGFGNLIALALQKGPREKGNRMIGLRLPPPEAGEEAWAVPASGYRKEPPIVGELPGRIELILGNQIYIAKEGSSARFAKSAASPGGLSEIRSSTKLRRCGPPMASHASSPARKITRITSVSREDASSMRAGYWLIFEFAQSFATSATEGVLLT
jgi:hypothetical protein